MKQLLTLAAFSIGLCQFAAAELKVPGSVFKMDELEEAQAKATKDKEPLI
ncbi:MAG: hypothetical protein HKN23_19845, partial [Verrucomicrobiales bacterium]|nr:hypothetical protein [Verrucomicrobiales bacterium]